MKKSTLKVIFLVFLAIFLILLGKYTPISNLLNQEYSKDLISSFGIYAPIIYILVYILIILTLMPVFLITVLSGILFGTIKGIIYTMIGSTIGSTLAFLISRNSGQHIIY